MNVRADRQTEKIHVHYIYMGLAQAHPNEQFIYVFYSVANKRWFVAQ